jgi:hypothetical protein
VRGPASGARTRRRSPGSLKTVSTYDFTHDEG